MMHDIDAETVDAAVEPKAQHLEHGVLHLRIAPVEIGLLFKEGVVVILPGRRVPFPRTTAKIRYPIVGRTAIRFGLAPDIPVAFSAVARRARIEKPGMTIRGVVRNVIEQHFQAAAMRVGEQRVEVIEAAEDRIDIGIIVDVVAEVRHRRRINRRKPNGVHAQPLQIVEPASDAGEIADAIAVAVHKRTWIDLIDDTAFPPFEFCPRRSLSRRLLKKTHKLRPKKQ